MDWGLGWHMYAEAYGMMANGDLLYSTGHSAQCSTINLCGKESERE